MAAIVRIQPTAREYFLEHCLCNVLCNVSMFSRLALSLLLLLGTRRFSTKLVHILAIYKFKLAKQKFELTLVSFALCKLRVSFGYRLHLCTCFGLVFILKLKQLMTFQ